MLSPLYVLGIETIKEGKCILSANKKSRGEGGFRFHYSLGDILKDGKLYFSILFNYSQLSILQ